MQVKPISWSSSLYSCRVSEKFDGDDEMKEREREDGMNDSEVARKEEIEPHLIHQSREVRRR